MNGNFQAFSAILIGDLTWVPQPIEVKLFSTNIDFLKREGPGNCGKTDSRSKEWWMSTDGLVYAGPSLRLRVRPIDAQRYGLDSR